MADSYSVKVFKFDPSVDAEPSYRIYEVPHFGEVTGPVSALKALHYINENIEPVGYDFDCRVGGCARCIIKFNGKPRLACWSRLEEGKENTLEPLDNFPIVKDLVVDNRKAFAKFVQSDATVKTKEPLGEPKPIDPDLFWEELYQIDRCNECMSCYSVCQALNDFDRWQSFIGPGALMQIYAKHFAGEDESDRIQQAANCGVFQCVQCGQCTQICNRRIPIHEHIKTLMTLCEERNLKGADSSTYSWPLL